MAQTDSAVLDRAPETDEASCVICKCTDDEACPGGCAWVPKELGVDVCSACCESLAEAIGR